MRQLIVATAEKNLFLVNNPARRAHLSDFVVFDVLPVVRHAELLRVDAPDDERVAEVVHPAVAELFAFKDELVAPQFPAVILVGGFVDGGGNALVAALKAGLDAGAVGDPRADNVALAVAAKKHVEQYGQKQHYGGYGEYRMYAVASFHRWRESVFFCCLSVANNCFGCILFCLLLIFFFRYSFFRIFAVRQKKQNIFNRSVNQSE